MALAHLFAASQDQPQPSRLGCGIWEPFGASVDVLLELLDLLAEDIVIPFHKHVCPQCHNIPHSKVSRLVWSVCCSLLHPLLQDWLEASVKPGMAVLHRGKRVKPFHHWEPIYIGTNEEPLYDERLSWEGRSDKMAQVSTAH